MTVPSRLAENAPTVARCRIGAAPLRRLFEALAGPVGGPAQPGVCCRGLRTVAIDATTLHVPDQPQITHRYPKPSGGHRELGYPLLRLLVVVECGTRALLAAAFGPDNEGELGLASRLLGSLDATMLVPADPASTPPPFSTRSAAHSHG